MPGTSRGRSATLLETGERIRETQQRTLAGEASADELADAITAERTAIRALLTSARSALGARGTAAVLDRLGQTLRAAAIDETGRELLERGRLTEELSAVGFGPLEAVKPSRRRGDEIARAARERVTALRAAARSLAAQARAAEEAAREAEAAAQILQEEAAQHRWRPTAPPRSWRRPSRRSRTAVRTEEGLAAVAAGPSGALPSRGRLLLVAVLVRVVLMVHVRDALALVLELRVGEVLPAALLAVGLGRRAGRRYNRRLGDAVDR